MASIENIKGSDGSGNASLVTIQSSRSPGATTIVGDTVLGINPGGFSATMGTPHTFTDPVTSETITVISEATAVDFTGHVDGANLEIDTIAPGYTDAGSDVGDIVIIRPTTQYADELADILEVSHDDDGTIKDTAVYEAIGTNGVLGAVRNYTAGATWTKPANLKFIIVEVQGAGGGGSGAAASSAGNWSGAGGGCGGGYSTKKILAAALGATEAVTVGSGGNGGAAGNNNGSAGGNSSFGTHAVGAGGGGGVNRIGNASTAAASGSGGAPGAGTNGDINITGGYAPTFFRISGFWGISGAGGSSKFSPGATDVNDASGQNASGYGGGGSGAGVANGTGAAAGGNGSGGLVIVREYY